MEARETFNYLLDYNAEHGTWPEDKIGYVGYYKNGNVWSAWDYTTAEPLEETFQTEQQARLWVVGEFDVFDKCPNCNGVPEFYSCPTCKGTGYRLNQQSSNNFQPKFMDISEARLKKRIVNPDEITLHDSFGSEISIGDEVEVGEPKFGDLWNNSFVGTVTKISAGGFVTVVDQDDIHYEVSSKNVTVIF